MLGTLSQIVALCSAANGRLAGRFSMERFFPDHAEFKFCNQVRFVRPKRRRWGKVTEVEVAPDPNAWLRQIKPGGATKAILHFAKSGRSIAPDYKLAGLVGEGGTWSLIVRYPNRADSWQARWQVTRQGDPAQRIWTVTYGLAASNAHVPDLSKIDLERVAQELRRVLSDAVEFAASRPHLDGFAQTFQRGLDVLNRSAEPTFPDYVDFVCLDSYPDTARRLFAASYAAWVFGGIGSWNDMYFEDPNENRRYEDISANLYAAVTEAIQHSADSFVVP
jgi:hypothetical protein